MLDAIEEQGKLTPELREAKFRSADTKARLEDLYLPYRKRRSTRADQAREAGLEPLARRAARRSPPSTPSSSPRASSIAQHDVPDVQAALEGARQILIERFAVDTDLVGELRDCTRRNAQGRTLSRRSCEGKEQEGRSASATGSTTASR